MKLQATVRIDVADTGEVRLVATDPDDDATITDAIDLGRDGTGRRLFILRELLRRDGLVAIDPRQKGKVIIR